MGHLRDECKDCIYWHTRGEFCGAISHGMKCTHGPLPEQVPVYPFGARQKPPAAKPKPLLVQCIEIGLTRGYNRARKLRPDPTLSHMASEQLDAIMEELEKHFELN